MTKKIKIKKLSTSGLTQNKYNKSYAKQIISNLSQKEKIIKIKELENKGYGYNDRIHILLNFNMIVPYDFVFYCLLVNDQNIPGE